jgi:hypothetical protein
MRGSTRYWDNVRKGLLSSIEQAIRKLLPDAKTEVLALAFFYCNVYIYRSNHRIQKKNVSIAIASVLLALKISIYSPGRPRLSDVYNTFATMDKVVLESPDEIVTDVLRVEYMILELVEFNFYIPLPHERISEMAHTIMFPTTAVLDTRGKDTIMGNAKFFVKKACCTEALLKFTVDAVAASALRYGCLCFGVDAGPDAVEFRICDQIIRLVCKDRGLDNPTLA